jgi:hypothetical protein
LVVTVIDVVDTINGASDQFVNDQTTGIIPPKEDQSDAYENGRKLGRAVSNAFSYYEFAEGLGIFFTLISSIVPTSGGGGLCTALSGGGCGPITVGALAVEGAGAIFGAGLSIQGARSLGYTSSNPVIKGTKTNYNPKIDGTNPEFLQKLFNDPTHKGPGDNWTWIGDGSPESNLGNWVNESTGEWIHIDLLNSKDGPHIDYAITNDEVYRVYENGFWELK